MLLYDSIALLAPGTILTFLVAWLYPIPELLEASKDARLVPVLMLAYGVGHLLQAICQRFLVPRVEDALLEKAWAKFDGKEAVLEGLAVLYGTPGANAKAKEGQCLGPIAENVPRRDSFVTAADFNRAMVVSSVAIAALVVLQLVQAMRCPGWSDGIGLVMGLLGAWLFYHRYVQLRTYGALAAFNGFASFWAAKRS